MAFFADLTHFARFTTDPDFCYQEFARREDDHFQVFRAQVRTSTHHVRVCVRACVFKMTHLVCFQVVIYSFHPLICEKLGQFHFVDL